MVTRMARMGTLVSKSHGWSLARELQPHIARGLGLSVDLGGPYVFLEFEIP
jgi:hypothetical protein